MREVLHREDNIIDLSITDLSENFLFELTNIIENNNLQGKSVKINFGNLAFVQNEMENLLSLLRGFNIKVEMVYSESKETRISAVESGLTVSGQPFLMDYDSQDLNYQDNEDIDYSETDETSEEELENILFKETRSSTEKKETFYVKQTLRSGQKIEYDGNVIIIGDCNAGSEVVAAGDIIVWGILSGIAHAGNKGDKKACIRAFKINAIQLRIADLLARKPDRIDIDKMDKSEFFNPEEAKVSDGEIVIYSLHQEHY